MNNYDVIIIGSGAAGLNAADCLYSNGIKNIAIITEGLQIGTSINTGSDKQTYYKISTTGDERDSVYEMARTLFDCGGIEGFHALTESALSLRCFFKLVEAGVDFPMNEYGEYVGYRTDHDERKRASSCGPLTSNCICKALIKKVTEENIIIFEGERALKLLTFENKIIGLITLNMKNGEFKTYKCSNIILCVGGAAGIYNASVYPKSQTGGLGIAIEEGATAVNLSEWQYGIASTEFRWNLSGSYQQVIPRYLSIDDKGTEHEFLNDYFKADIFDAIFQKGYNWPFSPKNLNGNRSSLIDIAVYIETRIKNRKVYLDYTKNPKNFTFDKLSKEAYDYLKNSELIGCDTPINRLHKLNEKAYLLYKENGIDLEKQKLLIDVCAQHCNGGLKCDKNYRTDIKGLYASGECAGIFGITRPGGTALNSTQVSSLMAALTIKKEFINFTKKQEDSIFEKIADEKIRLLNDIKQKLYSDSGISPRKLREEYSLLMSKNASFIRHITDISKTYEKLKKELDEFTDKTRAKSAIDLYNAFINRDLLITSLAVLFAEQEYIKDGGISRGSFMVLKGNEDLTELLQHEIKIEADKNTVIDIKYVDDSFISNKRAVSPLPISEQWFEKVYNPSSSL